MRYYHCDKNLRVSLNFGHKLLKTWVLNTIHFHPSGFIKVLFHWKFLSTNRWQGKKVFRMIFLNHMMHTTFKWYNWIKCSITSNQMLLQGTGSCSWAASVACGSRSDLPPALSNEILWMINRQFKFQRLCYGDILFNDHISASVCIKY